MADHAQSSARPRASGPPLLDSVVLNITLQCPLKCSHCCFSSDMFQDGHLSAEDVRAAISQAAAIPSVEIVHFVGGDPLLHPDLVTEAVALASAASLRAGITTSAFWAKSAGRTRQILEALARAGLTEITISYDDPHAEFVRLGSIRNAVSTALALDLLVRVAVVVEAGSHITARSLRVDLGLEGNAAVKIYDVVANSTGRADVGETVQAERARHADVYRGPCQSVLRTATIDHHGAIRPCCGVLPHRDGLSVGTLQGNGIEAAMREAGEDPLLRWIRLEGPVAILARLTAEDAEPMRPEQFDGICTACDRIFASPELHARARAAAEAWRDSIALCELMADALAPQAVPAPGGAL